MDWDNIYRDTSIYFSIIFNKGFITTLYTAVATFALFKLRQNDQFKVSGFLGFGMPSGLMFQMVSVLLLFIVGFLEVNHQFIFYYPSINLSQLYLELYVFHLC